MLSLLVHLLLVCYVASLKLNSRSIHSMRMSAMSTVVGRSTEVVSGFIAFFNSGKKSVIMTDSPTMESIYLMEEGQAIDASLRARCKYDLFIPANKDDWVTTETFLATLLQRIRGSKSTSKDMLLDAGEWSHFVSLTFPSIDEAVPFLPEIRIGADAWELRVDLLADISPASLHRQMSLLRRVSPLPIVFTVRSEGQIGKFPKDPDRIFALLKEGLRAGAEWIDVEACWPQSHITDLTALIKSTYASTSRILGSLHVTVPQTEEQITELFRACDLDGAADMVKVVTGAANDADCRLVHTCGERAPKPYIGLCLGAPGSLSRVLNRRFTPVTHALMATAAPGQLTAAQLMERRLAEGLLTQRKYFLFGTPIQQSMSPAMHNAAYRALLLPHDYGLCESDSVEMYEAVLQDPSFGGASVTIPHKESIGRFLDEVSTEAKSIGAVNTVARVEGRLVGYNTDWLGIKLPISRLMSTQEGRTKGLVVGAGGTARAACFALKSLGLEVLVYNRSPEKGEELARLFGGTFVSDLSVLPCDELAAVVSTVPAQAQFTLPAEVIAQRPIVLDVVYKPVRTPLVEQALAGDCPCIQGATMLLEQGVQQFEIWNQRRAPRSEMDAAVFSGIDRI